MACASPRDVDDVGAHPAGGYAPAAKSPVSTGATMARVKLLSAMAFDVQTYEDRGVADPVIRVFGELPAYSQTFGLNRIYKGAQGTYEEVVLLVDPDGVVIWERPSRFIELRGEMFEDLFRATVTDRVEITSTGEHTLVFLLGGVEAGRVPVFIEAPQSVQAAGAEVFQDAAQTALKKGAIMWLTIPQRDGTSVSRAAWYVQQGAKLFVLTGPTEQELPNLEHCDVVDVTVKSKDVTAAIGQMRADVRVVDSSSEEFDRIANIGMGTRLNLADGQDALERWRERCTMVELTPQS